MLSYHCPPIWLLLFTRSWKMPSVGRVTWSYQDKNLDLKLRTVFLVTSLFEHQFSIRPPFLECRRIDKPGSNNDGNQPSRLLVHLGSEKLASEILSQAHKLRLSDDQDTRLNVFISPDMTPEESKLAFEERVRHLSRIPPTLVGLNENGSTDGQRTEVASNIVPPRLPLSKSVVFTSSTSTPNIADSAQLPPLLSSSVDTYSQSVSNAVGWIPVGPLDNWGTVTSNLQSSISHPLLYVSSSDPMFAFPREYHPQHSRHPNSYVVPPFISSITSSMPPGMLHLTIILFHSTPLIQSDITTHQQPHSTSNVLNLSISHHPHIPSSVPMPSRFVGQN